LPKSDQYRDFARECLAMAQAADDGGTRAVLVQMAQVWFRLAKEHAESASEQIESNGAGEQMEH
jgi:hypothetical protein